MSDEEKLKRALHVIRLYFRLDMTSSEVREHWERDYLIPFLKDIGDNYG